MSEANTDYSVLTLIARLNVGGPAKHVIWITKMLRDRGRSAMLVSGRVEANEADMNYFAEEMGVTPVYIEDMGRSLTYKDFFNIIKFYRILRREKPDILHTHTAKAGTVGRVAALLYRLTTGRSVRCVHTFHGHTFRNYWSPPVTKIFLSIERFLARYATDIIVAISDGLLKEINREFGIGRREQFRAVPLGIYFHELEPCPDSTSDDETVGPKDKLTVGYIGRLADIKNVGLFVDAVSILNEEGRAHGAKFAIVGDGSLRHDLEKKVKRLGISEIVTFTGMVDKIADIYNNLDVVIISSNNEGTPTTLIEGMALGIPFVATSVGGVPDIAGPMREECCSFSIHDHGIMTAPCDSRAFADAIEKLTGDAQLRESLGAAGKKFATEKFSLERMVDDLENIYTSLLNR